MYAVLNAESDTQPSSMPNELQAGPDGSTLFSTSLHDDWPRENGHLKAPGDLTDGEVRTLIAEHQHEPGINAVASNTVKNTWDNYQHDKENQGG